MTSIPSVTVCELLRLLAGAHTGVPITIVLDNARYQRCALVQNLAQTLGIELLFLPPYSPNLHLIERFWKFVKKQCLYSKYYTRLLCFGGGEATSSRHDRLLLRKQIAKDILNPVPELEALVRIEDHGLHECLGLLTTRFPNGFAGQAPFCR